MTDEQLADLRARITKGPWSVVANPHGHIGMREVVGPALRCIGFTIATDVTEEKAARVQADAQAIALVPDLLDEVVRLREGLIDCTAHLAAAISLLERGGKAAKKAAPSDKMFDLMLSDYRASVERARTALGGAHD